MRSSSTPVSRSCTHCGLVPASGAPQGEVRGGDALQHAAPPHLAQLCAPRTGRLSREGVATTQQAVRLCAVGSGGAERGTRSDSVAGTTSLGLPPQSHSTALHARWSANAATAPAGCVAAAPARLTTVQRELAAVRRGRRGAGPRGKATAATSRRRQGDTVPASAAPAHRHQARPSAPPPAPTRPRLLPRSRRRCTVLPRLKVCACAGGGPRSGLHPQRWHRCATKPSSRTAPQPLTGAAPQPLSWRLHT